MSVVSGEYYFKLGPEALSKEMLFHRNQITPSLSIELRDLKGVILQVGEFGKISEGYPASLNSRSNKELAERLIRRRWDQRVIPVMRYSAYDCDFNDQKLLQVISHSNSESQRKILLTFDPDDNDGALSKFLQEALRADPHLHFLVELPMVGEYTSLESHRISPDQSSGENETFLIWQRLQKTINYDSRVEVALRLRSDQHEIEKIKRWVGTTVAMIVIPLDRFVTKNWFPALPKTEAETVSLFLKQSTTSRPMLVAFEAADGETPRDLSRYIDYMELFKRSFNSGPSKSGHEDSVFLPQQPLCRESISPLTGAFEADRWKFIAYRDALVHALTRKKKKNPDMEAQSLLILGADRPALIQAAVNASKLAKLQVRTFAVVPRGDIEMWCLCDYMWPAEEIKLIDEDSQMAHLIPKIDILLFDSLGNFGDKEMNADHLNKMLQLLKDDGLSIPCKTSVFLQPVMAQRAYNQINELYRQHKTNPKAYLDPYETFWAVRFNSSYFIDEPKELWSFIYPNNDNACENTRYKRISFRARSETLLHGFSGYILNRLDRMTQVTNHPDIGPPTLSPRHSLFFPLPEPLIIQANDKIIVEFWRKVKSGVIWYEWKVGEGRKNILKGGIHPLKL